MLFLKSDHFQCRTHYTPAFQIPPLVGRIDKRLEDRAKEASFSSKNVCTSAWLKTSPDVLDDTLVRAERNLKVLKVAPFLGNVDQRHCSGQNKEKPYLMQRFTQVPQAKKSG